MFSFTQIRVMQNDYTPQQKLLNLVLCMASMIFNDSTKSSRHGMNKLATFCQIYLSSPPVAGVW